MLLEQMASGDMSAFDFLYKALQPKLFRYIFPFTINTGLDAHEIVQDIFVKMWLKRELLSGIKSIEHYLYRMARNRLIDVKRGRDTRMSHQARFSNEQPLSGAITENEIRFREFHGIALEAIRRLPERRRLIFEMNVDRDFSIPEIASQLKLSVHVVKKQLYLASAEIRKYLDRHRLDFILLPLLFISNIEP